MPRDEPTVRQWLERARNDLRTARVLIAETSEPILDTGAFHCQQAVEKLLKAVLCWYGTDPPRVHALGALFDLAGRHTDALEPLRDACERLTRYAVLVRYPWGPRPTPEEARQALDAAEATWDAVRRLLPSPLVPG